MMRAKLIALRERRAHLVARAQAQREGARVLIERAEAITVWIERVSAAGRWLRARPLLIAAGVMVLVVLRPRRTLKWAAAGISLWRSWQSLRSLVDQFVPAIARGAQRP